MRKASLAEAELVPHRMAVYPSPHRHMWLQPIRSSHQRMSQRSSRRADTGCPSRPLPLLSSEVPSPTTISHLCIYLFKRHLPPILRRPISFVDPNTSWHTPACVFLLSRLRRTSGAQLDPMAEGQGWEIIDCEPAGQELIDAVKAHILSQLLTSKPETKGPSYGYRRLRWHVKCEELFNHGWDLAANRFLTEHCGAGSEQMENTQKYAITLQETKELLPLLRLGHECIWLYKPVEDELSSEVGFFKIIPNSNKMSDGGAQRTVERVSISLKPNQVLVVDGGTVVDWPITGGGLALMKKFEKY